MYNKDILKKFMRSVLIESLGFIEMNKDSFPLKYDDYVDLNVDYINKKWVTYKKKTVNLNEWLKKVEMLSLPSVKKLVEYLSSAEEHNYNARDEIEPSQKSANIVNFGVIASFWIPLIVSAYINKFGTTFDEPSFDYTFDAWYESFKKPSSNRRILVLRNFVLDGFDTIDLLGYRIRPLKNYEIKYLIGVGGYNQHTQRYPLWDIPDGLKDDLNPAYCVEVPPLVFGMNDENVSTEYIKNRLLGLLLTYKEGMITMETELQYDIMSEFSLNYPGPSLTNYLELHHYFPPPYVLILSDYDKLSKYERLYANVKLDDDKALNLAIRRFLMPIWRFESEDITLDYMIALEALLSNSEQDIRYRISIRLAYLISDSPEQRLQISKIMGRIYNLRSHIVHGNAKNLSEAKRKLGELLQFKPEDDYVADDTLREYVRLTIQEYVIFSSKINCGNRKATFLKNIDQKILGIK
jgi:hypothetical protein